MVDLRKTRGKYGSNTHRGSVLVVLPVVVLQEQSVTTADSPSPVTQTTANIERSSSIAVLVRVGHHRITNLEEWRKSCGWCRRAEYRRVGCKQVEVRVKHFYPSPKHSRGSSSSSSSSGGGAASGESHPAPETAHKHPPAVAKATLIINNTAVQDACHKIFFKLKFQYLSV